MQVLQLGAENWADKYHLPSEITWIYNQYPLEKVKRFDLVIITSGVQLTDYLWEKLHWQVDPYRVLYEPLASGWPTFFDFSRGTTDC